MIKEYHVSENLFDKSGSVTYDSGVSLTVLSTGVRVTSTTSGTNKYKGIILSNDLLGKTLTVSMTISVSGNNDSAVRLYYVNGRTPTDNITRLFGSTDIGQKQVTFTMPNIIPTGSNGIAILFSSNYSSVNGEIGDYADYIDIMFNEGSTALPYEPYGNTWNTKSYCKATTGSKTYSNFPIVVRSREQSISSWNMKGNEQHTGTASPTSPIEINGTGDRTANLYFKSLANCSIDATGKLTGNSQFVCYVAKVEANKTYIGEKGYVYAFFDTEPVLGSQSYNSQRVTENARDGITSPINGYVVVRFNTGTTDAMLSEGTTILPYEPYGYKIPISANGTALTPVYLTEQLMEINDYVDSLASSGAVTRYIKKIVFNGSETGWTIESGTTYVLSIADQLPTSYENAICSHYVLADSYNNLLNTNNTFAVSRRPAFFIHDNTLTTVDALKTYLATQYANGTPVTVYYVIETAVTEQVAVPTIPTTSSPATIDVNTLVKPSEMSLTYDGYKICKKQKYQNDAWT